MPKQTMQNRIFHFLLFVKSQGVTVDLLKNRIVTNFSCISFLVTKKDIDPFSFCCGIKLRTNLSKSTALEKKIRTLLLLEGMGEMKLIFKKGWGPICCFFQFRTFDIFGNYQTEEILAVAHATRRHKCMNLAKKSSQFLTISSEHSVATKRGRWFVNSKRFNWTIKRAIVSAMVFSIIRYLLEFRLPEVFLFISEGLQYIEKWLMGTPEQPGGNTPTPEEDLNTLDFMLIILFIGLVFIIRSSQ